MGKIKCVKLLILMTLMTIMSFQGIPGTNIDWALNVNAKIQYSVAHEYDGAPAYDCVAFARYMVPSLPGGLGDLAGKEAIINSDTPVAGAISIESGSSSLGHVAYVESVNGNQITTLHGGFYDSDSASYLGETVNGDHIVRKTGTAAELGIIGYYVPNGGSGSNPVVPDTSSWTTSVDNLTETNAKLSARYNAGYTVQFQYAGCNIFDENGNMIAQAGEDTSVNNSYIDIWYDINSETHQKLTLQAGTTYKYQFYATYGGVDHFSPMYSFKTPGDESEPVIQGPDEIVLNMGYIEDLSCTVGGDSSNISYTSLDTDIVIIDSYEDDFWVESVSPGETIIRATYECNNKTYYKDIKCVVRALKFYEGIGSGLGTMDSKDAKVVQFDVYMKEGQENFTLTISTSVDFEGKEIKTEETLLVNKLGYNKFFYVIERSNYHNAEGDYTTIAVLKNGNGEILEKETTTYNFKDYDDAYCMSVGINEEVDVVEESGFTEIAYSKFVVWTYSLYNSKYSIGEVEKKAGENVVIGVKEGRVYGAFVELKSGKRTMLIIDVIDSYDDSIIDDLDTIHKEEVDEAVASSCTEKGKTEGSHCSVCGEVLVEQKEIVATGHTEVTDEAVVSTCTEKGKTEGKHCSVCGEVLVVQEEIASTGHTEVTDEAVAPTCTETGKTEGKHCSVCETVIVEQKEIAATQHLWDEGKVTKEASVTAEGEKLYTCKNCGTTKTEKISKLPSNNNNETEEPDNSDDENTTESNDNVTVGYVVNNRDDGTEYKVTKTNGGTPTVEFTKYDGTESSIVIPDVIKINGVSYKVTSIADNAFKNNKTVTYVIIGNNVKIIGKNAFSGCKNLKTVIIGKNVTTIGSKAFYNCKSLTKITIPSKVTKIDSYAFKNCKKLSSVTIGKSVKTIGKEAFRGCSKLKSITIKSKKLKTVGKNAFKGIKSSAKIKVPSSKLKSYKKLLKDKGQGKKVKITK